MAARATQTAFVGGTRYEPGCYDELVDRDRLPEQPVLTKEER